MTAHQPARIAVGPNDTPEWVRDAVRAGGGIVVAPADANGLIWSDAFDPTGLERVLNEAPSISWVQLPFAGSENFMHLVNVDRTWTSVKGVYSEPVAELVMGFLLGGLRHHDRPVATLAAVQLPCHCGAQSGARDSRCRCGGWS